MKILIATPIYPPEIGGPATYTKELSRQLQNKHKLTIVAYTDVHDPFPGTTLVAISKQEPLPIRLLKFFLAVFKLSREADLIYVQNAMAAGLPVALVNLFTGKPFVLKFVGDEAWERATQHHLTEKRLEEFLEAPEGNWKTKAMMMVQGWVLRRAKIVTTPSLYLSKEIIKAYGVHPERAIVNYNAADDTVKNLPFGTTRIPHQIATTARLVVWKGIDGIIRALPLVQEKYKDARLVVAGDGPEIDNLNKLIKELHLEGSVTLLGKISRVETWQLRKNSEIYVLNSTYEGLPHTVLTSFAAEIPTVATNISGTNEAIYGEKTGLLVEPGDTQALAHAIMRLFEDKALRERLVVNGTKLLKEKFSWEAHVRNLEGLFRLAMRKPGK
ncbi:MAG: glycosyltransferase family 4 protein [Candidatus Zambryskibacteria bacterium]|nr:glycosyltransferase family 4 protein [Candidatus Zambryskibacteria bacterium]